jgi:uncharacterized membrane protein YphA (DoxX/SURF4 family)
MSLVFAAPYNQSPRSISSKLFCIRMAGYRSLCRFERGTADIFTAKYTNRQGTRLPQCPSTHLPRPEKQMTLHPANALRARGGPVYVSLLRIWLAAALLTAAAHVMLPHGGALSTLSVGLPIDVAARVPADIALFGGVLLLLGLGTRYICIAALLGVFANAMIDPRETDAVYLLMSFSILIIFGGGALSLDRAAAALIDKYIPQLNPRDPKVLTGLPRVVIVGAAFAGISCAAALRNAPVTVTLIDLANSGARIACGVIVKR